MPFDFKITADTSYHLTVEDLLEAKRLLDADTERCQRTFAAQAHFMNGLFGARSERVLKETANGPYRLRIVQCHDDSYEVVYDHVESGQINSRRFITEAAAQIQFGVWTTHYSTELVKAVPATAYWATEPEPGTYKCTCGAQSVKSNSHSVWCSTVTQEPSEVEDCEGYGEDTSEHDAGCNCNGCTEEDDE